MTPPGGGASGIPPAPLLDLEAVHTYYGESHVLQGVTLHVEAGRITCLVGRNGAGKTTTVRTVMGFTPPRGGRIAYDGRPITGTPPHRVARLGIALVPQGRGIFADLTVRQHLTLADRPGGWSVDRACARFPILQERGQQPAGLLSGGEQQMLAIARALVMGPRLVILDEPSDGLAPLFVAKVRDILLDMRTEGLGVLLVEQNLALAHAVADRLYVLNKGRVVFEGTPADLDGAPDVRARFLGV
ncbi:MAG TPA: ABC transporter ATP-binding protein [bacterium]|nr:ABC transporter ATP-binding protein [bacterium]